MQQTPFESTVTGNTVLFYCGAEAGGRGTASTREKASEQAVARNERQIDVAIEHFLGFEDLKDRLEDFFVLGDLLNGLADQIGADRARRARIRPRPCVPRRS